ncbi:MAG: antibiotic biosynthesis monooxygenase [Propionicimonas sp.]
MAISRFEVDDPSAFRPAAEAVVAHFSGSSGCLDARLLQNLDEPRLWAIVTDWVDVGSYRRSFNGTGAKLLLVPLLSQAIDEPSAYAPSVTVGENRPRGTVG